MTSRHASARSALAGETPLRYPLATLYTDYLRAAAGLALTLGPLLLLDVAYPLVALLAALGLLFAWFGLRTVTRHLSRVELSGSAIAVRGPRPRYLAWGELERVRLAHYAPRRARDDGWLQLTLRGAGGPSIRLDSTLVGFEEVLGAASRAARAKALPLDAATQANLAALGLAASGSRDEALPVSSPGPPDGDAVARAPKARW
ncbi:MAG TPA: hypothetical protein VHK45_00730 [Geminicoccaceae bacterium]|jgi:hypothetical protein|nr:hypothetical protein [Geminicoccaceae bacterium]